MSVAGVATARQRCRHQRHPLQGKHHTHVISITPELLLGLHTGPILSVFPALIVHSELKSVHPGFPVAFIF